MEIDNSKFSTGLAPASIMDESEVPPVTCSDPSVESVSFLIAEIVRDDDNLRPRRQRDPETVETYATDMTAGAEFPPIKLMRTGDGTHYLVDGDHRIEAAVKNKRTHIKAIIYDGTLEDARWAAAGSNKTNGLRRSKGDKQKAIRIAVLTKPDAGNDEIAQHVGVSHSWVEKTRREMTKNGELTKADNTGLSSRDKTASGGTRRRHNLSVDQKVAILDALAAGKKAKDLAKKYGVTAETISRLKKKEKNESEGRPAPNPEPPRQKSESDGVTGGGDPRHDEPDVTADLQQSGVKEKSVPLRQNGREGVETVKEVVAHIDEFVAAHLDQCPKLLCALEEALERIATTIAAVPESLRNDADFRRIWPIWLNDRHRRKYSCAPRDLRSSLKALASMAPDAACRALAFAIHNRLKYIKPEHGAALGNTAELGEKRSEPSPPQHPAEQAPETEPITIVLNGRQLEVQKHHGMWRFRPPGDTAWGHAEPESTITIEEHVRALKK